MITGIIAEFNPFHKGHEYLINCAKKDSDAVICAMSGDFVQRGSTAIFSKKIRTKAALKSGCDIVVEMPSLWSMSSAGNFALCGVWQLYNMGANRILFGSECGDIDILKKAADILNSDEFNSLVTESLKSGMTYANARNDAFKALGGDQELLKNQNDNLGIEYILAAKRLNLPIDFCCVKRIGAMHDGEEKDGIASGMEIRRLLLNGDCEAAKKYMPDYVKFTENDISDVSRIDRAVLAILRQKTAEDFLNVPDVSEGLDNKLFTAVKFAKSVEELCMAAKSKRYTLSRIRRIVFAAALGFDKKYFMTVPPYTRVLGAGKKGLELLKKTVSVNPVFIRVSDKMPDDEAINDVFKYECLAADLYALTFKNAKECGEEYKRKFITEDDHD